MNKLSITTLLLALTASMAFTPATKINGAAFHLSHKRASVKLHMSEADEATRLMEQAKKLREEAAAMSKENEEEAASAVSVNASVSADGTFYDDEVDPQIKDPLSDNMRQRLMREASTGLDSNQKQTNVILYISVGIAVLVALGGQGILF
mmetsp:Transcript_29200/g.42853  ORF Transcript_29200/g.42853 Transcript_29200/m.42853 type:complete len:150 (-) Transcript_29200:361-810(-)|eukprot:CAMPEP_0116040512 /NCGR_PEP_ID=MMETSP0321-20121206/24408_1 /TAXON_ID=163516 /ORGANISM="Leptocylindrus danicus var. danicus, Strain B650" /LENGTH=149 /DNA_ID=CAMNT_0003520351 /DNA_START=77 /DNA_END=526 /DNA_ORIENTATION=+